MVTGVGDRVAQRVPDVTSKRWPLGSTTAANVALTVAFIALLGAWSIAVPLFEAPDERAHVDMVEHRANGGGWPRYDAFPMTYEGALECWERAGATWACPNPSDPAGLRIVRPHGTSDAPPKSGLATFAELPDEPPPAAVSSVGWNQQLQHPTLYYEIVSRAVVLSRWPSGPMSFAAEVGLMRAMSVLLMAPVPVLCWWAARRGGLASGPARAVSLMPFVVPQFAHIGSSVNNDVGQILLGSIIVALAAGVARGDRRWTTALGIGVSCGLALLMKSSSVVFPPLIVAAYVAGWWPDRKSAGTVRPAVLLAASGALTAVIAAWWYVGNKIRYGTFVPSIHSDVLANVSPPEGVTPAFATWAEFVTDNIPSRSWGYFGPFAVRMSWPLILASTIAIAALVAMAVWPRRPPTEAKLPLALAGVLSVPVVGLVAMVGIRSWRIYAGSGTISFMQGRYLFPAFAVFAVAVGAGAWRVGGGWAPAVIGAWAVVMQTNALLSVLDGYWAGAGVTGQVRAMVAWSPWQGDVLASLAVVALLSLIAAVGASVSIWNRTARPA